ncbi:unnamed protein product [Anisakis simplex]|uniref:DUF3395 domain-containing protein n=1 Tax=Anisakis simplex TaxID=6269 RepID=A0A0M3JVA3_ANISI|nr:unnamed protein product [Anisakis simplex]
MQTSIDREACDKKAELNKAQNWLWHAPERIITSVCLLMLCVYLVYGKYPQIVCNLLTTTPAALFTYALLTKAPTETISQHQSSNKAKNTTTTTTTASLTTMRSTLTSVPFCITSSTNDNTLSNNILETPMRSIDEAFDQSTTKTIYDLLNEQIKLKDYQRPNFVLKQSIISESTNDATTCLEQSLFEPSSLLNENENGDRLKIGLLAPPPNGNELGSDRMAVDYCIAEEGVALFDRQRKSAMSRTDFEVIENVTINRIARCKQQLPDNSYYRVLFCHDIRLIRALL